MSRNVSALATPLETGDELFGGLDHTPHQHFTLYLYAALLRVLGQVSIHYGSAQLATDRLPFLAGYFDEIAGRGMEGASFGEAHARWREGINAWERASSVRLPLAALRAAAGLNHDELTLLAQIGLPDEDPRLGLVFDELQGGAGQRRATFGLLAASWQIDNSVDARAAAHRLQALGLIETDPADPAALRPCAAVWDAVRGAVVVSTTGWARFHNVDALPQLESLILPHQLRSECELLPHVIESGAATTVILRGPRHNGRSTLAGALARSMNKGLLHVTSLDDPDDMRWCSAGTLACLLNAVIFTTAEPAPSEAHRLPDLPAGIAPLFVSLSTIGGLTGTPADRAITLRIPIPDAEARKRLWSMSLGAGTAGLPRLRMTSGNIVRAATVARAAMTMKRDAPVDADALRAAVRTLERPGLEALARRVDAHADWSQLALSNETHADLATLAARCRQRERLGAFVGAALGNVGPGVRALFKGPSGTGKTLAAQVLASALEMDLYRVDLASVVNKYIGETEKNLERVFARAEELDIILLLDEGDSLLTQRTNVQSANDRYANLETNYLLQRLENYDGIIVVTTNAGDRIDTAFQRRMDFVIDFALPDAAERWLIWQLHLPSHHEIQPDLLNEAVQRCALSGAQIRNVALHASLLAIESDRPLAWEHVEAAVEREYRKQSAVSPLRTRAAFR